MGLWLVVNLGGVAVSGTSGWHFEADSCFRERSGGEKTCPVGHVDLDSLVTSKMQLVSFFECVFHSFAPNFVETADMFFSED